MLVGSPFSTSLAIFVTCLFDNSYSLTSVRWYLIVVWFALSLSLVVLSIFSCTFWLSVYLHIWMWELDCEEAEHWRIDVFELWCWRRLLRVPWTARTSNQSILKEINPGISLEGMMLKLKHQYFGHLMWRVDSLEKTATGRDWWQEKKGTTEDEVAGWHHGLDGRESEWTPGVDDGQGGLACCDSWGRKESDMTEQLNWTELISSWDKCLFTSSVLLTWAVCDFDVECMKFFIYFGY